VSEVDLNDVDDINAFVFLDDEGFDWNRDINKTVNLLRRRNIQVIVANSDKYYPISNNDVAIAIGGISRMVESVLNQKFLRFGKPDTQMFMYAFDNINQTGNFTKNDILMVGDTLNTDILGGNKFGMKTLLVLSGNTRAESVYMKIKSSGIIPDYLAESIMT
jgi:HAD superfamily hydrolase (TIGR01450 family)